MLTQATVLDRFAAENFKADDHDIMISISDSDDVWPKLEGKYGEVLYLTFDSNQPFTMEHAKQICDFVKKYDEKEDWYHLIVHCNWGVHRSTAIAQFLNDCYAIPVQSQYGLESHIDEVTDILKEYHSSISEHPEHEVDLMRRERNLRWY